MPPRVVYRLTSKGEDLVPIVEAMRQYRTARDRGSDVKDPQHCS